MRATDPTQRTLFFDHAPTDEEILELFPDCEQWFSRKAIADALGVSKSPSLVLRLEMLVMRHYLARNLVPLPNSVDMVVYRLQSRLEREIDNQTD